MKSFSYFPFDLLLIVVTFFPIFTVGYNSEVHHLAAPTPPPPPPPMPTTAEYGEPDTILLTQEFVVESLLPERNHTTRDGKYDEYEYEEFSQSSSSSSPSSQLRQESETVQEDEDTCCTLTNHRVNSNQIVPPEGKNDDKESSLLIKPPTTITSPSSTTTTTRYVLDEPRLMLMTVTTIKINRLLNNFKLLYSKW